MPRFLFPMLLLALSMSVPRALLAEEVPVTTPHETPAERDARMAWFREARFGMFIHWGLYSVAAGEWDGKPTTGAGEWIMNDVQIPLTQYAKLVPQFNPVKFDAHQWVRLAKDAGMKYIVITTKHHDGFAIYPSALTDWCIKSTPFHRDPLKELADACQEEGIKLCFYHSIMDWHHPNYAPRKPWNDVDTAPPEFDRYVDFMKGQLKELLTNYGAIGIVWFDGNWEDTWNYDRGVDLLAYVRRLQPDTIVNNRVAKDRQGVAGTADGQELVADYGTPEQYIPPTGFGPGVDWETCMTMNGTWGFKKSDENWKSTETLIRNLVDIASKGGNYLLNVGPTGEGEIPAASVKRLQEVAQWMHVNGPSIHGTTASPFAALTWGRCTKQMRPDGGVIYLHVFDWPQDGKLRVPGLKNAITKASFLTTGETLATSRQGDDTIVALPAESVDKIDTVIALEIAGPLELAPQTGG